jgi:phosphoribosylglycinamide formyltransferase 1
MKKLAVLVSGSGTTLAALADACKGGKLQAEIYVVISNKEKVGASQIATKHNLVPYVEISRMAGRKDQRFDAFGSYQAHSDRILWYARGCDLVVCAGYLGKLHVTPEWEGRILNIHPSLLPKYGGKGMYGHHVHQAVLDAKEEWTGCTVHIVDNEYDHGPILAQQRVRVNPNDTPETLAAAVQAKEREVYWEAIQSYLGTI